MFLECKIPSAFILVVTSSLSNCRQTASWRWTSTVWTQRSIYRRGSCYWTSWGWVQRCTTRSNTLRMRRWIAVSHKRHSRLSRTQVSSSMVDPSMCHFLLYAFSLSVVAAPIYHFLFYTGQYIDSRSSNVPLPLNHRSACQ